MKTRTCDQRISKRTRRSARRSPADASNGSRYWPNGSSPAASGSRTLAVRWFANCAGASEPGGLLLHRRGGRQVDGGERCNRALATVLQHHEVVGRQAPHRTAVLVEH